jgi:hypothetical protein
MTDADTRDASGNSVMFSCKYGQDGRLYVELGHRGVVGPYIEFDVDGQKFNMSVMSDGGEVNTDCNACADNYVALWNAVASGNRLRKSIEQDLIDDPYARRVFSEMLKEAIREAEALFDHPNKQYTLFKDLEAMVNDRATPTVPDQFGDNRMAQAFYGAFVMSVDQDQIETLGESKLVEEALFIDQVVQNAVRSHSINPASIEAEIRKSLLPRLFNLLGGLDAANGVIEQVVVIVHAGDALGRS